MKPGRQMKIAVFPKMREYSNAELRKRYGISRITAWRIRTGRIDYFYIPAPKEYIEGSMIPIRMGTEFRRLLGYLRKENPDIDIEDLRDILADARLYIIEYIAPQGKTPDDMIAIWYTYAKLYIRDYRKRRKNSPILVPM